MPQVLKKIGNPQEDASKISQNFDTISLALADLSGTFSSEASIPGGVTIAAGTSQAIEVNILDQLSIYQQDRLPVVPRLDLYIDQDLDGTYLYPLGSSLTAAQVHGISVIMYQSKSTLNQVENEKATYVVVLRNDTADSHDFFFYFDAFYVPSPDQGVAARGTA